MTSLEKRAIEQAVKLLNEAQVSAASQEWIDGAVIDDKAKSAVQTAYLQKYSELHGKIQSALGWLNDVTA